MGEKTVKGWREGVRTNGRAKLKKTTKFMCQIYHLCFQSSLNISNIQNNLIKSKKKYRDQRQRLMDEGF